MAFADPIVLVDNAAANQNFVLQGRGVDNASYIESDATGTLIRSIKIMHQNAGKSVTPGQKPKRRATVQFRVQSLDTVTNRWHEFTANLSFLVDPGASSIDLAAQQHIRAFVSSFCTNANMEKLLRSET